MEKREYAVDVLFSFFAYSEQGKRDKGQTGTVLFCPFWTKKNRPCLSLVSCPYPLAEDVYVTQLVASYSARSTHH